MIESPTVKTEMGLYNKAKVGLSKDLKIQAKVGLYK